MFNNITESWKVLHQNYQFLWSGEHSQNLIVDLLLFQKKYRTGETIFVNVVLTKSLQVAPIKYYFYAICIYLF